MCVCVVFVCVYLERLYFGGLADSGGGRGVGSEDVGS